MTSLGMGRGLFHRLDVWYALCWDIRGERVASYSTKEARVFLNAIAHYRRLL